MTARRRQMGAAIFERAIARGELRATADIEFALDLLPSTLYWQMVVLGRRVTRETLLRQAKVLLAAIRPA